MTRKALFVTCVRETESLTRGQAYEVLHEIDTAIVVVMSYAPDFRYAVFAHALFGECFYADAPDLEVTDNDC